MRIYKITLIVASFCLCLISCESDKVPKKDYDEIYNENKQLKESLDATQTANLKHAATVNKTLAELAEISGTTLILRGNIENGTARVTQAEKIKSNIQLIKNKITSLEKQIGNETTYKKIVANLKTIIKEKEAEINSLKEIIENQNSTITEQKTTINQQNTTINNQQQEIFNKQEQLQQAVKIQARLLYQAASELEKFAKDVPDVSRKKNQKKVNEWAISMLLRSRHYYEKSQKFGIDATSDIWRINLIISEIKNKK